MSWRKSVDRVAAQENTINFLRAFHHRWCNPKQIQKSYVKEGLQGVVNVLPSGPFKKVSKRPTVQFHPVSRCAHTGHVDGDQADSQQVLNGEQQPRRKRELLLKTAQVNRSGSTQETQARIRSMA